MPKEEEPNECSLFLLSEQQGGAGASAGYYMINL